MGLSRDAAAAAAVARTEARRSARAILGNRRQLAALVVAVLGFVPFLAVAVPTLYAVGGAVAVGDVSLSSAAVRGQFVTSLGGLVGLGAIRGLERSSTVEHADFLLTAVSPRALAVGLFLAEYLRTLTVVVPGFLLLYGAFLLGAGAPATLLVALPALAPAILAGLAVGHLVGVGTRLLTRSSPLPDRTGTALGVLFAGGLFVGSVVAAPALVEFVRAPPGRLAALPVAAYADLFLVATPAAVPLGPETALAAATLAVVPVAALGASVPVSARLWLGDDHREKADENRTVAVPTAIGDRRHARFVFWLWLRGVRRPTRFVHLLYLLFLAVPVVGTVAGARRPLLWVPALATLLGAALAGATFGLNPLGDEGDALPSVVLAPLPAATLVRARMLGGVALWLPPTLLVVLAVGVAGPMQSVTAGLLAVLAVVLSLYSVAVAVGVGTLVPRFRAVRSFGVETVSPTAWALFGHGAAVAVGAVVGFAAVAVPRAVLETGPAEAAGLLLLAGLLLAVPAVAGYRYAVYRVETFTYD